MRSGTKLSVKRTNSIPRRLRLARLAKFPFPCPNCDQVFKETKLYCSEACAQEAEFVRYVRRCRKDGRYFQPDVQLAIRIRRAHILAGGYSKRARRLLQGIRNVVKERDGGVCQICGQPGSEIDHIRGGSKEMNNLQLLCDDCHNQKTKSFFTKFTKESHPEVWEKARALDRRMESRLPIKLCDAEEWCRIYGSILSRRRDAVRRYLRTASIRRKVAA